MNDDNVLGSIPEFDENGMVARGVFVESLRPLMRCNVMSREDWDTQYYGVANGCGLPYVVCGKFVVDVCWEVFPKTGRDGLYGLIAKCAGFVAAEHAGKDSDFEFEERIDKTDEILRLQSALIELEIEL